MIHPSAIIGDPPEARAWKPGMPLFAPEIASDAQVNAFVSVDAGMHRSTRIGARSLAMKHCHVGHDCLVGEDCEFAPGVMLGGDVTVCDGAKVGLNACVLPYRRIGAGAIVGAGAVVTRDVPDGAVVAGNPATERAGKNPVPYSERRACRGCGHPIAGVSDICPECEPLLPPSLRSSDVSGLARI